MGRKSLFVDEINARWIALDLPAIAAELRAQGDTASPAATQAAADAAGKAERERIVAVIALFPGVDPTLLELVADPSATAPSVALRLVHEGRATQAALSTRSLASGSAHLAMLREDEAALAASQIVPDGGLGFAPLSDRNAGRSAVALAVKTGAIR